jgi:hypothetical protein
MDHDRSEKITQVLSAERRRRDRKRGNNPNDEQTPLAKKNHTELDLGEGDPLTKTERFLRKCVRKGRKMGISLFRDPPGD